MKRAVNHSTYAPATRMTASTYKSSVPIGVVVVLTAALCFACGQGPEAGRGAQATPQSSASPGSPIPWGTIQPPSQIGPDPGSQRPQSTRMPVRTFRGTGVVRSVNLPESWLEIEHEAIEGYMPAMRMQWRVRNAGMLRAVRVGDKVDFTLEDDNGTELLTELKKAAP